MIKIAILIIATILLSGCIVIEDPIIEIDPVCIVTPIPIVIPETVEIIDSQSELDTQMSDLFDNYAPKKEYVIDAHNGSEIYVCSHFSCDMAENLISDGYNAGVVINWNQVHALTWIEIGDQIYVIEPQNGDYWTVEEYDADQNIDVVSLQKGREHAKTGSENFHS